MTRLIALSVLAFIAATTLSAAVHAGGYCGYVAPVYKAPYVAPYVAPTVQVIVAPVGIPFPVQSYAPLSKQGASYYSYAAAAPRLNPNLLVQHADRLVQQASQSTSLATQIDSQTGEEDAAGRRVDAAIRLFEAMDNQRLTTTRTTKSTYTTAQPAVQPSPLNAVPEPPVEGGDDPDNSPYKDVDEVLNARCVKCHAGYAKWEPLKDATKFAILKRITSSDPRIRMPRFDKTTAGEELPFRERLLFMSKLSGGGQ